jgi:hypothetical protein
MDQGREKEQKSTDQKVLSHHWVSIFDSDSDRRQSSTQSSIAACRMKSRQRASIATRIECFWRSGNPD